MRTTIDQHISDLLYSHECVVVPGFGAFLTRYYPAEINTATNMLRPPSKRVAFNQRINENDGLLAKQVAKVEGVSYEKALESLLISVRSWQRILSSGKKINLYGVGRLFYDDQGLMQFSPALDINYNIHSYGLNIFRATAMEREQQIKRSVNRAIENNSKTTTPNKSSANKNPKRSTAWVKWAAILGPVVALVLYGYFNPEKVESAAGYVTNAFSGSSSETRTEEDATTENSELKAADKTSANSGERNGLYNLKDASEADANNNYNQEITEAEKSDYGVDDAPSSASDNETSQSSSSPKGSSKGMESNFNDNQAFNFQIVVGAFSNEENAKNYMDALAGRGYDAYLANSSNSYTRVAVGRLADKSSALSMLAEIRQDVNYQAWLNEN